MYIFSKSLEEGRAHFPVTKEWAYFETASTGLVPDFVYDGVRRYIDSRYYCGGDSRWEYDNETVDTLEMLHRSKKFLGEMIGCCEDDITFGQSSTQLFTLVTEGIDYEPDDNIVTVQRGWIGSRFAWQKRQAEGLDVRFVYPVKGVITPDMLIHACDEHTRAISVNLVESTTGYRIDIDELGSWCREHDILLFVDGVQALGVMDVNVEKSKIDFLVGNDYKWMSNFCGTGYAYVSPKVHKLIKHWGVGWMSDTNRFDTSKEYIHIRKDAGRFEIGHQHNDGVYGLSLVARQNCILGQRNIEHYVLDLASYFMKRSRETRGIELSYDFPEKNYSQIISIGLKPYINVTDEKFKKAKVFTHVGKEDSNGLREIRVGLHYYNNKEDIDRFFDVINQSI